MMKWLFPLLFFCSVVFGAQNYTFIRGPRLIESTSTTATAAGTTTLTATSNTNQEFTGTTTQTVVLPNATTLDVGSYFFVSNISTGVVTVEYNDASTAQSMGTNTWTLFILENNGTSNGTWDISYTNNAPMIMGAFGSSPNANAGSIVSNVLTLQPADGTHPGGVSLSAQTLGGGDKTFTGHILTADGTSGSPGVAFSSETNTGFYRSGAGDEVWMVNGAQGLEAIKSGSAVNWGFGASGSASAGSSSPFSVYTNVNQEQFVTFGNNSAGTSSAITFLIAEPGSVYLNLSNFGQSTTSSSDNGSGNLNGGSGVIANLNNTKLFLVSEYSSGAINFNVGGRTAATQRMSLNSTGLTLNGGTTLNLSGSSSGTITTQTQAASGTYNWNWPITAGAQGALLASGGGSTTAETWVADVASGQVLTSAGTTSNPAYSATPTLGVAGSQAGTLALASSTASTGLVTISNQGTTSGNAYTLALPLTAGSNGQPMITDGSGNMSFGTLGAFGGGTGVSNPTAHYLLVAEGSSPMTGVTPQATGYVLCSNGATSDPLMCNNPQLGVIGTATGTIRLASSTASTGLVTLQNQGTTSGNAYTFQFPLTGGTSGFALTTNGSGTTTWTAVLTNPATAAYDTYYQNAGNTAPTNLANGSTDQTLTATSSAAPSWETDWSAWSFINGSITATVASNALTIALKDASGSNPSASSAVKISERSSTATTGSVNLRRITGALSQVISSGTSLGMLSGVAGNVYVYLIDSDGAGTMKIGASTYKYSDAVLQSAIPESAALTSISNGSPAVFTLNGHGLNNGDAIQLTTSGSLPSGLSTATTYYVVSSSTNTFNVSATVGGTAINTSTNGSGTHTYHIFGPRLVSAGVYTNEPVRLIGRINISEATAGTWASSPTTVSSGPPTSRDDLYHFNAHLTDGSPPTIVREDPIWISTIVHNGAGDYTFNIPIGLCNSVPTCTASCSPQSNVPCETGFDGLSSLTARSSTVIRFNILLNQSASDTGGSDISCTCEP